MGKKSFNFENEFSAYSYSNNRKIMMKSAMNMKIGHLTKGLCLYDDNNLPNVTKYYICIKQFSEQVKNLFKIVK